VVAIEVRIKALVLAQVGFLGAGRYLNLLALLVRVGYLLYSAVLGIQDTVTLLQEQVILAQLVRVAVAVMVQLIIGVSLVVPQTMLALVQVVEAVLALMVEMEFQVAAVLAMEPLVLEQTLVATVVQDLLAAVVVQH
jgi:hypothetical protein